MIQLSVWRELRIWANRRSREAAASRHDVLLLLILLVPHVHAAPVFPVEAGSAMTCSVSTGPCVLRSTGGRFLVTLDITPKPVLAMRMLSFSAEISDRAGQITDAEVTIDLSMPGMVMGKNTVALSPRGRGAYVGQGVIVRCPSGKKRWQATVNIRNGSSTSTASCQFEVER